MNKCQAVILICNRHRAFITHLRVRNIDERLINLWTCNDVVEDVGEEHAPTDIISKNFKFKLKMWIFYGSSSLCCGFVRYSSITLRGAARQAPPGTSFYFPSRAYCFCAKAIAACKDHVITQHVRLFHDKITLSQHTAGWMWMANRPPSLGIPFLLISLYCAPLPPAEGRLFVVRYCCSCVIMVCYWAWRWVEWRVPAAVQEYDIKTK